ncbi:hypothetical protein FWF89_00910 [Candidatus Saccharibacteria bacterium]|nr:hypothetical protein [Candidatus Saccharibacteria bacterium]
MYSSLNLVKNSRRSGKLIGTHQKLCKASRRLFTRVAPKKIKFPSEQDILYFEGSRGPDGVKRKSPGVDEPWHAINPDKNDGKLMHVILDHQHNLRVALKNENTVRAAFEAAWLAHAIADGLTPAHHYPYDAIIDELMVDMEYKKVFGAEIKGIMRGRNLAEATRNNWLYWGAGGVMSKHIAFELGVAYVIAALPLKSLTPKLSKVDPASINLKKEFEKSLKKVSALDMYGRFLKEGWTTQLAIEARSILAPEIVRVITLAWLSSQ